MTSNNLPSISKAEIAVMKSIWKNEPVSVRQVFEEMNSQRQEPLSRNTVLKHIQRLETKGWLTRDDGRPALYHSTVSSKNATDGLVSAFKEMLFDGSTMSMVRCLVNGGKLAPEEIAELQQLIDSSEAKKG